MQGPNSDTEARTELAALVKERERVRCILEGEGSEQSLVGDVMRSQYGILQASIRQHCREHGLTDEQRSLLPALRLAKR